MPSATRGGKRQVLEPGHRARRRLQPGRDRSAASGKSSLVRPAKRFDAAPSRGRFADDQQATNSATRPAAFLCKRSGKTRLSVEDVQHRLGIWHDRFDLDHEDRGRRTVHRQDVDRAALARDGEGCLDYRLPAQAVQAGDHRFNEPGVSSVEQTIEAFTLPTNLDVECRAKSLGNASQRIDLDIAELSGFDLADQLPRVTDTRSKIGLAPAFADPEGPACSSETQRLHQATMAPSSYRRLIEVRRPGAARRARTATRRPRPRRRPRNR